MCSNCTCTQNLQKENKELKHELLYLKSEIGSLRQRYNQEAEFLADVQRDNGTLRTERIELKATIRTLTKMLEEK